MDLAFVNEPEPSVDVLAVIWTAGDPFKDPAPNAVADWIHDYDLALGGKILEAMAAADFTWANGQRLRFPTAGSLGFGALLLVGATPPDPSDWQGWRHVGCLVRQGLSEAEARRPGLLVERIFPTGLAELTTGLITPTTPDDVLLFESLTFTGGICWTEHDRRAVMEVCAAHLTPSG